MLTDVKVNNSSVVKNGVANIPKADNNKLGTVALGYTDANNGYALKVDSNGKGYVNVPWTDTTTTKNGHYTPSGTATNATYVNGNLTQSTGSVPLTHGSSLVITGVKYNKDEKGHVTDISYSLGKLPSVSDTIVDFAKISYQASSISSGGIVSGVVKNNLNRTSGNVTTEAFWKSGDFICLYAITLPSLSHFVANLRFAISSIDSPIFEIRGASFILCLITRSMGVPSSLFPVTQSTNELNDSVAPYHSG